MDPQVVARMDQAELGDTHERRDKMGNKWMSRGIVRRKQWSLFLAWIPCMEQALVLNATAKISNVV